MSKTIKSLNKSKAGVEELENKYNELLEVYKQCKEIALKHQLNFVVNLEKCDDDFAYTFIGNEENDDELRHMIEDVNYSELSDEKKQKKIEKLKAERKGYIHWHNSSMRC